MKGIALCFKSIICNLTGVARIGGVHGLALRFTRKVTTVIAITQESAQFAEEIRKSEAGKQ